MRGYRGMSLKPYGTCKALRMGDPGAEISDGNKRCISGTDIPAVIVAWAPNAMVFPFVEMEMG